MSERVKSLKLSRFLVLLIGLAVLLGSPWTALAACCSITQASTQTGLVKAREGAAGRTFELTVTDATQRRNLKVGQPVEANFDRNTAELPPSSKRYQISNVSSPAGSSPAGRLGAGRGAPAPTLEGVMTNFQLVGSNPGTTGGMEGQAAVLLTGPVPAGPLSSRFVTLASSNAGVLKVPVGVEVPVGERVGTFTFITTGVAVPTEVTITATYQNATKTGTVRVVPPQLLRIEIPAASVIGGLPVEARVILSGPPANSSVGTVKLSSANTVLAKVPASITVPTNTTQATFRVETFGVSKDTPVVISATHAGDASTSPKTDTLTLQPPRLKDLAWPGSSWCPGPCTRTVDVVLEGKAPAEGLPVTLASSRPGLITIPASATVPAGSDKLSVGFNAGQVGSNTKVTLSASYGDRTKKEDFTIYRLEKHDLFVRSGMELRNRFNLVVTQPEDSQEFSMCVNVATKLISFHTVGWPPPTALGVKYMKGNVGREFQVPVAWVTGAVRADQSDYDLMWVPTCFKLPGLQVGERLDVEVVADVRKELDERSESNNDRRFRVERK